MCETSSWFTSLAHAHSVYWHLRQSAQAQIFGLHMEVHRESVLTLMDLAVKQIYVTGSGHAELESMKWPLDPIPVISHMTKCCSTQCHKKYSVLCNKIRPRKQNKS